MLNAVESSRPARRSAMVSRFGSHCMSSGLGLSMLHSPLHGFPHVFDNGLRLVGWLARVIHSAANEYRMPFRLVR